VVQDRVLFHPGDDPYSRLSLTAMPDYEEVEFISNGKKQYGMLRKNASSEPSPLIIFFYGNAQSASGTMRSMETNNIWPYFLDYHCLIVDYPGYGPDTNGKPSAKNIYESALAAYDYARDLPWVDGIIAGGYSLGTGPAVYLAAQREVDGLFLFSPYANTYDLYNNVVSIFHGPLRIFVKHQFHSDYYAKQVNVPVLLIASHDDRMVPFESSAKLNACFESETTFIKLSGVRHFNIMFNRSALEGVRTYLESLP